MKTELQTMTMEDLRIAVERTGLDCYITTSGKSLCVVYCTVDCQDPYSESSYEQGSEFFNGEIPYEIYQKVMDWLYDDNWVITNRLIILNIRKDPFNIDLELELLQMGFKYVDVIFDNTNFVTVDCRYCYRDSEYIYHYDGVLRIDNQGDKKMTLEYIRHWIDNFNKINKGCTFDVCKNKL